jgi:protein PhnA
MSETMKACPQCDSPYGYFLKEECYACPECSHEWNPDAIVEATVLIVKDSNGNILVDGDSVIVIKDLAVKGSSSPIKGGTKVKRIRLSEGDHNISCKIEGFGAMALKSEFVRKA